MDKLQKHSVIGVVLVLIGLVFFLRALGIVASDSILLSPKMYTLYAAGAFFLSKHNNYAIGCLLLSVIVWFEDLYGLVSDNFKYLWPLLFVVVGVLILSGKLPRKKSKDNSEENDGEEKDGDDKPFKI